MFFVHTYEKYVAPEDLLSSSDIQLARHINILIVKLFSYSVLRKFATIIKYTK